MLQSFVAVNDDLERNRKGDVVDDFNTFKGINAAGSQQDLPNMKQHCEPLWEGGQCVMDVSHCQPSTVATELLQQSSRKLIPRGGS